MPYPPKIANEKKERSQFPLLQRQTTQKCTYENRQSFSKRFFDGDIPHILLLVSDFQAIEEAIPCRHFRKRAVNIED